MLDRDKPIQGVGVYMEFTGPYGKLQYLITPHGFSEDGALLKPYAVHRMIRFDETVERWKREILAIELDREATPEETAKEALSNTALRRFRDRVSYGDWTLVKTPMYLEVSKKDLTALRQGKTPTALMNRIKKIREVAEFSSAKEES